MAVSSFQVHQGVYIEACVRFSLRVKVKQKYKNEYHLISPTIPSSALSITTFKFSIETKKTEISLPFAPSVGYRCEYMERSELNQESYNQRVEKRKSDDFIKERSRERENEGYVWLNQSNIFNNMRAFVYSYECFTQFLTCCVCVCGEILQSNTSLHVYVQVDYTAAENSKALISQSILLCLLHVSQQQGIRDKHQGAELLQKCTRNRQECNERREQMEITHLLSHSETESVYN